MTAPVVDIFTTPDHAERSLRRDALLGLTSTPKWLPPRWFYDARGSDLFEEITRLPEYYPTRAESAILSARAGDIARHTGAHTLVELGSGSSEKTRLLLDALQDAGTLRQYVPLDVSQSALRDAVGAGVDAGLDRIALRRERDAVRNDLDFVLFAIQILSLTTYSSPIIFNSSA